MSPVCDRDGRSSTGAGAPAADMRPSRALAAWLHDPPQQEACERLHYLLTRSFGCGLLTGPGHCGKSHLLQAFRTRLLRTHAMVLSLDGAGLDREGLFWNLAAGCGLGPDAKSPSTRVRHGVTDLLQGTLESGRRLVFLLDHADAMSDDALHAFCRILRSAEAGGKVTAIWAARWPLAAALRETLLPLTELRIETNPLSEAETEAYVLQASGQPAGTFDPQAIAAIRAHAAGRLRRVDHLCQLALMAAQADERTTISRELIDAVALELA